MLPAPSTPPLPLPAPATTPLSNADSAESKVLAFDSLDRFHEWFDSERAVYAFRSSRVHISGYILSTKKDGAPVPVYEWTAKNEFVRDTKQPVFTHYYDCHCRPNPSEDALKLLQLSTQDRLLEESKIDSARQRKQALWATDVRPSTHVGCKYGLVVRLYVNQAAPLLANNVINPGPVEVTITVTGTHNVACKDLAKRRRVAPEMAQWIVSMLELSITPENIKRYVDSPDTLPKTGAVCVCVCVCVCVSAPVRSSLCFVLQRASHRWLVALHHSERFATSNTHCGTLRGKAQTSGRLKSFYRRTLALIIYRALSAQRVCLFHPRSMFCITKLSSASASTLYVTAALRASTHDQCCGLVLFR